MKVIIVGAGISALHGGRAGSAGTDQGGVVRARHCGQCTPQGLCNRSQRMPMSVLERLGLVNDLLSTGVEQVTNFVITDQQGRTCWPALREDARHQTYRVQRDHLQSVPPRPLATTQVNYGFQGTRLRDDRHAAPGGFHRRPSCGRRRGGRM